MEPRHRESATSMRGAIARGDHTPAGFRAALLDVPLAQRDAWVDAVLGLEEVLDDGAALPRGCVPYLPASVEDLLHVVERAPVTPADVFVDVGAGPGRASALVHLLTGARVIGVEVQPQLVVAARALATRMPISGMSIVEGDAAERAEAMSPGTVFFLYCPFGGARLDAVLAGLERIACTRSIRVCCVDLVLPPRDWLVHEASPRDGVSIHRSAG